MKRPQQLSRLGSCFLVLSLSFVGAGWAQPASPIPAASPAGEAMVESPPKASPSAQDLPTASPSPASRSQADVPAVSPSPAIRSQEEQHAFLGVVVEQVPEEVCVQLSGDLADG